MSKTSYLTAEGLKQLQDELEYLKTVDRKEKAEQLKEARGHGDLSENSEYDEAKNAQAISEARIRELEEVLKDVVLVDEDSVTTNAVQVGLTVRVLDMEYEEEETLHIVGTSEIDLKANKISDESPVGKGLLGHHVGDVVAIETPGGEVKFKVLEITKS